jgi:hypothetical protein
VSERPATTTSATAARALGGLGRERTVDTGQDQAELLATEPRDDVVPARPWLELLARPLAWPP